MPFPLAHPAAVLPLRRFCPRRFNFAALVVGSVTPDFGYFFGPLKVDVFSHHLLGSFLFCLPAGLLVLWLFYGARERLLHLAPEAYQRALFPICQEKPGTLVVLIVSVLVGAWTHVLWDGFTHKDGWFVLRLSVLQFPVASVVRHQVRVFHVLWYACSFAGIGWLFLVFESWRRTSENAANPTPISGASLARAFAVGSLAVLLAALHHLARHGLAFYCAGGLGVVLVVVAALRLSGPPKSAR